MFSVPVGVVWLQYKFSEGLSIYGFMRFLLYDLKFRMPSRTCKAWFLSSPSVVRVAFFLTIRV